MLASLRDTQIYFDVLTPGLVAQGDRFCTLPGAFVVHGGPGLDHTSNRDTFLSLADRLQLVLFDHRGQGRSARGEPGSYTLDNNVEDMEALRRHLGLDKITVIGTSYGGIVALSYAVRYPERVDRLIVIVTAAHGGFLKRARELVHERGTPEQIRCCRWLFDGSFETVEQMREYFRVMGPMYALRYDPVIAEATRDRVIYSVEAINQAFGGFLRTYDIRDRLPGIAVPTLVLGGNEDWICAPEFSREIAGLIPGARLEIFADCGHAMRSDQPERMLCAIREFLIETATPTIDDLSGVVE